MHEKIILYSPDCQGCAQLKNHLEKLGVAHKYKAIDVSTKQGNEIANRLGVKVIPNCAIVESTPKGKLIRVCNREEFDKLIEGK